MSAGFASRVAALLSRLRQVHPETAAMIEEFEAAEAARAPARRRKGAIRERPAPKPVARSIRRKFHRTKPLGRR